MSTLIFFLHLHQCCLKLNLVHLRGRFDPLNLLEFDSLFLIDPIESGRSNLHLRESPMKEYGSFDE